jgi:hypothetical protein
MKMTAAGGRYIIVGRSTYRQNYYYLKSQRAALCIKNMLP